jgi:hypothetical protein
MPPQPIAYRFNRAWFALLILSTIPAIVILVLILRYGVNMPYFDQWDCEGKLFKKFWEHQLTWGDFWEQHNEHRMFFPKMIYLALAYATHWNVIAELIVTWLCVCIVSFSVYRMYRSADGPVSAGKMIPFIAANILIFTPACDETWLWGVSVANLMPMACIFGAMAIACSNLRANVRWSLCAVLAIIATFSTASGLLCWILCAPLLFLRKNSSAERQDEPAASTPFRLWHIVAWCCGFALTTAIYFYHYARPAPHPPPSDSLKHPIELLSFLVLYQGNSITFTSPTIDYMSAARFVGGVMIVLMLFSCVYVAIRWRDRPVRDRALIWLMIGAYSILNGILIAVSRMEISPVAATWTRYVSYSVFLPVSLIFLVPIVVEDISRHMWPELGPILMRTACGLLAATMVFQIFKFCDGLVRFKEFHVALAERKASLLFIDLVRFDSTPGKAWREQTLDDIRPLADALNAHGWINPSLIQRPRMQDLEDSTVTNSEPYGKMEQPGNVGDGRIGIIGWAYDPRRRSLADAVVLSWEKPGGDGVPFAIAEMGIERSSEATNSPLRYSGWQLGFPSDLLPAETLHLRAWCFDTSTGKAVALLGAYRLTVNPSPPGGP